MTTATSGIGKLLVIDSNVLFAKRLSNALREEGFEVNHSMDAAYALTMLEWDMPDAILCATNLREMGAFEIVPILHADQKTLAYSGDCTGRRQREQPDGCLSRRMR